MDKQNVQNLIRELIGKINIKINEIEIEEDLPNNTWFRVKVEQPEFFIQRDGEALYALNHLVKRILEAKMPAADRDAKKSEEALRILIDINDFQKKRIENVRAVAHMMSERARYFKSNIEVDPMSAFERRIVHEFLSGALDLKTESVGFGPARRVVIKYIGNNL